MRGSFLRVPCTVRWGFLYCRDLGEDDPRLSLCIPGDRPFAYCTGNPELYPGAGPVHAGDPRYYNRSRRSASFHVIDAGPA